MIPLDNDDAERRHGVEPTYKKKKGFQPLQMNWAATLLMPYSVEVISIPTMVIQFRK
jgi:hypothetical protein